MTRTAAGLGVDATRWQRLVGPLAVNADRMTAGVGLLLLAPGHAGGWLFAVGGSQSIADALVARLESLGGEVRCNHRVQSMADVPSARAVLFDLTPRQVLAIAGDRFPSRYRRRWQRWRYGSGSFKVDWALDGPVPWSDPALADAGVLHIGGPAAEVIDAERAVARGRIPRRPFTLFAQATVADPPGHRRAGTPGGATATFPMAVTST